MISTGQLLAILVFCALLQTLLDNRRHRMYPGPEAAPRPPAPAPLPSVQRALKIETELGDTPETRLARLREIAEESGVEDLVKACDVMKQHMSGESPTPPAE